MTPITRVKNLGKAMARWLADIEIYSKEDLQHIGSVNAYKALTAIHEKHISLNALWAMYAGLEDRHWCDVTQKEKKDLLKQLDL